MSKIVFWSSLFVLYLCGTTLVMAHSSSMYYNEHHKSNDDDYTSSHRDSDTPVAPKSSGVLKEFDSLNAAVKQIQEKSDETPLGDQIKILERCTNMLRKIDHTAEVSDQELEELKNKGLEQFRKDINDLENKLYVIRPTGEFGYFAKATYPELITPKTLLTLIKNGSGQFHYKRFPDPKKQESPMRCWQVVDYKKIKDEIEQLVKEGRMSPNEKIRPKGSLSEKVSKLKNAHASTGNALTGYSADVYIYEFKYTDNRQNPLVIKVYQVKKEKCDIPLPDDSKK